jgi:hypothetical protein
MRSGWTRSGWKRTYNYEKRSVKGLAVINLELSYIYTICVKFVSCDGYLIVFDR